uniref:S-protein homolog n=1 Tax=Humulus scandens TaxID=228586 RepID=A0A6J3WU51_HUMSC|nr:Hum s 3 allergen [Humulus scandens]
MPALSVKMLALLQTCIIVTTLFSCAQATKNETKIEQVDVRNVLDGKQDLSVYCKSRNNEFNTQILSYKGTRTLNFTQTFNNTEIHCSFSWDREFHNVQIFMPESLNCRVPDKCFWYINLFGICLSHTKSFTFDCFDWGKQVFG